MPLYSLPAAVTLQNVGEALVPNHLFNETEFVRSVAALGYRKVDEWQTELACRIPFFPEHSINAYKGYYFAK